MKRTDITRRTTLALVAAAAGSLVLAGPAAAQEQRQIRLAKQFGISYLPLTVMEEKKLLEKHTKAAGLGDIKVEWSQLASGAPMNDALLSGNLDIASGGVGPFVTIWSRTKGNLDVKGVVAMNSMPIMLNTRNPSVKSLKDFTDKDRIALPAPKVSIQAVTLQMAARAVGPPGPPPRGTTSRSSRPARATLRHNRATPAR